MGLAQKVRKGLERPGYRWVAFWHFPKACGQWMTIVGWHDFKELSASDLAQWSLRHSCMVKPLLFSLLREAKGQHWKEMNIIGPIMIDDVLCKL